MTFHEIMPDERLAAAVGMFDGVHLGHREMVRQVSACAKARGLKSAIFTFTQHPLQLIDPEKAPRLLTSILTRRRLLCDAGADYVFALNFDDTLRNLSAEDFMTMLHGNYGVDLLVVGFNHHFGKGREGDFESYRSIGRNIGIEVVRADEVVVEGFDTPVSSSMIRRCVAEGDISQANALLGRPYSLRGIVLAGFQIGRTLGYPTANVEPIDKRQLIPMVGVYLSYITLRDGRRLPALVNVGYRPTISPARLPLLIEAHILDFHEDLYGCPVELEFVRFLREERKFPSLDALARQIKLDLDGAIKILYNE